MNILQMEDTIKGLPDETLMQEAEQPTGQVPQYLVISEVQRRTDMRKRYQQEEEQPQGTVADQVIQEGIAGIAPPPPEMGQAMNGGPPQGMYHGGVVHMQDLGQVPFYPQLAGGPTMGGMQDQINTLIENGVPIEDIKGIIGEENFRRAGFEMTRGEPTRTDYSDVAVGQEFDDAPRQMIGSDVMDYFNQQRGRQPEESVAPRVERLLAQTEIPEVTIPEVESGIERPEIPFFTRTPSIETPIEREEVVSARASAEPTIIHGQPLMTVNNEPSNALQEDAATGIDIKGTDDKSVVDYTFDFNPSSTQALLRGLEARSQFNLPDMTEESEEEEIIAQSSGYPSVTPPGFTAEPEDPYTSGISEINALIAARKDKKPFDVSGIKMDLTDLETDYSQFDPSATYERLITEEQRRAAKIREDAGKEAQSMALIKLGAGIAGGDLSKGLSEAGTAAYEARRAGRKEASLLDAAARKLELAKEDATRTLGMKGMESNRALRLAEAQADYELKVDVAKLQFAADEKEFGELVEAITQKSQLKRYADLATESERSVFRSILTAVGPSAKVWLDELIDATEVNLSTEDGQEQLLKLYSSFIEEQMAMYAAKAGLVVPGSSQGGGGGKYQVKVKD
jgi:hypothetical protein